RPGRVDGDAGLLVRALDDDLRDGGLLEVVGKRRANPDVLVQQPAVFALAGVPARIPGAVDAEPQPDRIDLLTHQAVSSTSRTTIVMCENGLWIRPTRPRPRGVQRFMTSDLPT